MVEYKKLSIAGMSCAHCEKSVSKAVQKVSGVEAVERISWEDGDVIVQTSIDLDREELEKQIKQAGYKLNEVSPYEGNKGKDKNTDFDIIVIGGGSAGFAAAIRGAGMDKKVALIEDATIGGTCVNIGCVPSKYIIHEAFTGTTWDAITKGRDTLVENLRAEKYINVLDSYTENVTYIHQQAQFIDKKSIQLADGTVLTAGKYILTTGSKPVFPRLSGIEDIEPLDSTGLLFIKDLPKSIIIVGGRFIALELGQTFAKLGVQVTILQRSSRLIPQYDIEISEGIEQVFNSQGITVITGTQLVSASKRDTVKTLVYKKGDNLEEIHAEQIIFATGRKGNTESLHLDRAGVATDSNAHIITDKYLQTSNPQIFAAGDVLATPGLVYVAAKEGQTAAGNSFADVPVPLTYDNIPEVIFTHPQIAKVGITEDTAVERGFKVSTTSLYIADTPYGLANNDTKGIIKLIKNADSEELLGGEIMAKDAGNMIQTLTIAIQAHMRAGDIINTYFPYLTAVEGIKLGAIIFEKDVHTLSCCAS